MSRLDDEDDEVRCCRCCSWSDDWRDEMGEPPPVDFGVLLPDDEHDDEVCLSSTMGSGD